MWKYPLATRWSDALGWTFVCSSFAAVFCNSCEHLQLAKWVTHKLNKNNKRQQRKERKDQTMNLRQQNHKKGKSGIFKAFSVCVCVCVCVCVWQLRVPYENPNSYQKCWLLLTSTGQLLIFTDWHPDFRCRDFSNSSVRDPSLTEFPC